MSLRAIVTSLWNSPNGGTWNASTGFHYFGSQDEAFGIGVGYMNGQGAWGGGSSWAASPDQALRDYNGGRITPGMVEGFYRQQWGGQYYNISAGVSPSGNGFDISFTFNPTATKDNLFITWTYHLCYRQLFLHQQIIKLKVAHTKV